MVTQFFFPLYSTGGVWRHALGHLDTLYGRRLYNFLAFVHVDAPVGRASAHADSISFSKVTDVLNIDVNGLYKEAVCKRGLEAS